jgi:hypothetical protein
LIVNLELKTWITFLDTRAFYSQFSMDNPLTEFLSVPTLSVNFTHSITLRFSLSETFELPTLLSSFKGLMGPCETPFLSNLPVLSNGVMARNRHGNTPIHPRCVLFFDKLLFLLHLNLPLIEQYHCLLSLYIKRRRASSQEMINDCQ